MHLSQRSVCLTCDNIWMRHWALSAETVVLKCILWIPTFFRIVNIHSLDVGPPMYHPYPGKQVIQSQEIRWMYHTCYYMPMYFVKIPSLLPGVNEVISEPETHNKTTNSGTSVRPTSVSVTLWVPKKEVSSSTLTGTSTQKPSLKK